jgi:type IV secretory pathway VirB3-like protein
VWSIPSGRVGVCRGVSRGTSGTPKAAGQTREGETAVGLIIALLVLWLIFAVVGFVVKSLFWLAILGIVLFVVTGVFGAVRRRSGVR